MPKTRAFDEHAEAYDRWFDDHVNAYLAELAAVKLALPHPGRSLEVGIGTGRFAEPLGITDGIEPSGKMADAARARGLNIVSGTAEKLPFPDGIFDSVLMVTVICFLDDVPTAFREAWRVLRPGGALVVGFVDAASPLGREYVARAESSRFYADAAVYSCAEVIAMLLAAGFKRGRSWQTIFFPPEELKMPDRVVMGNGRGSFVVIRVEKPQ